jgi:hypothetical protein
LVHKRTDHLRDPDTLILQDREQVFLDNPQIFWRWFLPCVDDVIPWVIQTHTPTLL